MTQFLVEETSGTADPVDETVEFGDASTSESRFRRTSHPSMLIAGLVLAAMVAAGPSARLIAERRRRDDAFEQVFVESDTGASDCDQEVMNQVAQVFQLGRGEHFVDGMHSAFSRAFLGFLAHYGPRGFRAMKQYLGSTETLPDVVSEALRWTSEINNPQVTFDRWMLLEQALRDPDPRVRDGAVLAIGALDESHSRPALERALASEQVQELRSLINQVLAQLNS